MLDWKNQVLYVLRSIKLDKRIFFSLDIKGCSCHLSISFYYRGDETFMRSKAPKRNLSGLSFASLVVFFLVMSLMGCYQSVNLKKTPLNSDVLVTNRTANLLPVAYLKSIQVELNGSSSNVNPSFEQRFVGRLQEAGIFTDVIGIIGRERQSAEPHYNLFLKTSEIQHFDRFGNAVKGFFVGLSLFVLSPVLPADYGHEVSMTLIVQKPNGDERKYYASAEASALFTLTHQQTAIQKAMNDSLEKCIISVINQLAADGDLRSS